MRRYPFVAFLIAILILLLMDYYVFLSIKRISAALFNKKTQKVIYTFYWFISIGLILTIIIGFSNYSYDYKPNYEQFLFYLIGFAILNFIPKLTFVIILLFKDVVLLFIKALMLMVLKKQRKTTKSDHMISRGLFLEKFGLLVSSIPFFSITNGIVNGRFDYKIYKETINFRNLPSAFNGLKIVQISDVHLGSLNKNYIEVARGIDMINQLSPDLIFFTGDFINNFSQETFGWEAIFNKLTAKLGKFAILGNHDYGDYGRWDSMNEKQQNFNELTYFIKSIGFKLLMNDWQKIKINNQSICIIGVENWGNPPFKKYGDLQKATRGCDQFPFKILLSHDPSHWDAEVKNKTSIDLTFSGHLHGFQFGFEFGSIKWSPIQYKYPKWAGLYSENKQYLYVNRGFGYIGFPGRVGIRPEITLLEIRNSQMLS